MFRAIFGPMFEPKTFHIFSTIYVNGFMQLFGVITTNGQRNMFEVHFLATLFPAAPSPVYGVSTRD